MKRIVFLILLFFSSFNTASVAIYFEDNFTSIDTQNWQVYYNGGVVESENDQTLKISSTPSYQYPYIHSRLGTFPLGSYKARIRFKFNGSLNYGAGIVFSDKLITNLTTNGLSANDVVFQVWPESQSQYSLWTSLCEQNAQNCSLNVYKKISSFPADSYNDLTIEYDTTSYSIKLNDLSEKIYIATRGLSYLWVGNPQQTITHTSRPNIFVEYFIIETPDISKDPVVILPGFGGSWDVDAVLTNSPGNNWKIPDFIKEYDGIINSLKNAGYEENKDLFIFAYDWRKPLDALADDLKNFLLTNNIYDKKVSFVGHSMGGLVARSYLQKYNNPNTEKVITVGSPNKGILDAYGMWEGLTIWDGVWWQKALHLLATEVNRGSGETELQAARRVSPSVKDLLPTSDFLQKDEQTIPISQMAWKNDYLLDKNSNISNFTQRIFSGFSSDYQSKNKLLVTIPTKEDNLKGLWQDGKPIKSNPFLFTLGDGYVTSASSGDLFDKQISLIGNHGEVISKKDNIVKILEELGVATESAVGSDSDTRKKLMVFKLNSPGTLEVCQASICDTNLGLVFAEEKMIMIPGFAEGKFEVKVKSFGETGNYNLQIGELNETAEWNESGGKLINTDQVDSYYYDTVNNQTVADQVTNNRNILLYFPHGIDLKNVNKIRQDLLRQMDLNIGLKNTQSFDLLIEKWIALDNYVSSLDPKKTKGMNHKDWGDHDKGFVRSRFITKIPDYFTERLMEVYTDLEVNSEKPNYSDNFYKLDKKMQLKMLNSFLRL